MRQRKVKNLEGRLNELRAFFVDDVTARKGRWSRCFENERALFLELGCGKGNFILSQATAHPENNYIAFEGQLSVVFRALQKLDKTDITNVRFACAFVNGPADIFAAGELSGIYLNFSDPWPKLRHAPRRLMHRGYLAQYRKILKPGGFVEMKTDNAELFEFAKSEVKNAASGLFQISEITDDLHRSRLEAKNITTEYEDKFMAEGRPIRYMKLVASGAAGPMADY